MFDSFRSQTQTLLAKTFAPKLKKVPIYSEKGIIFGHIVLSKGMDVDKAKVESISKILMPKTVKDIYSFLGHTG